jgi:threonine aldolase
MVNAVNEASGVVKFSFQDDYSEGCHPQILEAMVQSNLVQQAAYGNDEYSLQAAKLIQTAVGNDQAAVHFVASGTLANLIVIASALRPHEAVIAAGSGHIAQRETGAIEATGHRIITMPSSDGKLTPDNVLAAMNANAAFPHMTRPRMLYVSNATEFGTVYTGSELRALRQSCDEHNLLFFIDGARLGTALAASKSDIDLKDIAGLADVFWIGGTKAGAMAGEAIVIVNPDLMHDFAFHVKQRGAMLAKGRLLGLQFKELFTGGLLETASQHANAMAAQLSEGITGQGYSLAASTDSNQVFPLLPDAVIAHLAEEFLFHPWLQRDENQSVIRLVTSWATEAQQVDAFLSRMANAKA